MSRDAVFTRRHALLGACLSPLAAGLARAGGPDEAGRCRTGRRQSPIDIHTAQAGASLGLRADYQPSPLRLVHDGHTVRWRLPASNRLWISGVPHRLQQLHFHLPGGDQLHGESFPLGLHLPHKAPSGQLVTLVALFRSGAPHAALQALLPHLPAAGTPERTVPGGLLAHPADWLPPSLACYDYEGSLTSAPCTEGVRWLVLQTVQTASPAQLQALGAVVAPNARAVQPLNGRRVVAHTG